MADTCLTGIISIESSTDSDSVLSFYVEPTSVKSDLVRRIQSEFVSN